ncbi:MAG: hypothetical protein WA192_14435 [Candidatus Acidiferrales bacterium]
MKRVVSLLLGSCLVLGTAAVAVAQEANTGTDMPPKIMVINREVLKPGKAGSPHQKTESAFVRAMAEVKSQTYYTGMDALSGVSRSLFLTGYDSFAAWEKDTMSVAKDAKLSAALDRASVADGELLDAYSTGVFRLNTEQSLNLGTDLSHDRYFEIGVYQVKPGHEADWDEIMKLVKAAYAKVPGVQWAMYERVYGGTQGYHVYFMPMRSAAEIDEAFANGPKFMEALGPDGMKKLSDLLASAVETSEINLFVVNPAISYVSPEMIKANPEFWKPAPAEGMKRAAEKKPAE